MAYVTEKIDSVNTRLQKNIDMVTQVVGFADKLKHAKVQRENLRAQSERMQQQAKLADMQMQDMATTSLDSIYQRIAETEDPKEQEYLIEEYMPKFQKLYGIQGQAFNTERAQQRIKFGAKHYTSMKGMFENYKEIARKNPEKFNKDEAYTNLMGQLKRLSPENQQIWSNRIQDMMQGFEEYEGRKQAEDQGMEATKAKVGDTTFEKPEEKGTGPDIDRISKIHGLIKMPAAREKALREDSRTIASYEGVLNILDSNPKLSKNFVGKSRAVTAKVLTNPTVKNIGAFIGLNPEKELSDDERLLMQQMGQAFQSYRTDVTGAQAAVEELDRLEKLIPDILMDPKTVKKGFSFMRLTTKAKRAAEIADHIARLPQEVRQDAWNQFGAGEDQETQQMIMERLNTGKIDNQRFKDLVQSEGKKKTYKKYSNKSQIATAYTNLLKGRSKDELSPDELDELRDLKKQAQSMR